MSVAEGRGAKRPMLYPWCVPFAPVRTISAPVGTPRPPSPPSRPWHALVADAAPRHRGAAGGQGALLRPPTEEFDAGADLAILPFASTDGLSAATRPSSIQLNLLCDESCLLRTAHLRHSWAASECEAPQPLWDLMPLGATVSRWRAGAAQSSSPHLAYLPALRLQICRLVRSPLGRVCAPCRD